MKSTSFPKLFSVLFLIATLALAGCGGGDSDAGAVDSAEVSQLEAKVAQGDADAALKLAELHAQKNGNREAQIEAAKWFHIATRLGHTSAAMGLNAVTANMPLEDQTEVELRVAAYKLPAK